MPVAILILSALTLLAAGVAVKYAIRADRRDSRRADVDWKLQRTGAHHFEVVNVGRDEARDVEVRLRFDENPDIFSTAEVVKAGEAAIIEDSNYVQRAIRADEDQELSEALSPAPGPTVFVTWLWVSGRVTWKSTAGRWDEQSFSEKLPLRDDE